MIYRDRLKELREEKNLKARDMDRALNFNIDTYKVFESERTIFPIIQLNSVANYFNVSLDYLFDFVSLRQYEKTNCNINTKLSSLRLKDLRKEVKVSQLELANLIGSASTTISGYERGSRIIATPFLYQICKKYKISADYLLGKIDEPKYLN